MTFDNDFKEAISLLPSKEKDKLILRLLKRDEVLAKRLYFELVSTETQDERRDKLARQIVSIITRVSNEYYSAGYLMMDMRSVSGQITLHVKIAKDKFGEVSLNLLLLNEVLRRNNKRIMQSPPQKVVKLSVYIIEKAYKILMLIIALHEDYRVEFYDALATLGKLIGDNSYLMKTAIRRGFDVNWLLTGEIPEDIKSIYKELKSSGI